MGTSQALTTNQLELLTIIYAIEEFGMSVEEFNKLTDEEIAYKQLHGNKNNSGSSSSGGSSSSSGGSHSSNPSDVAPENRPQVEEMIPDDQVIPGYM